MLLLNRRPEGLLRRLSFSANPGNLSFAGRRKPRLVRLGARDDAAYALRRRAAASSLPDEYQLVPTDTTNAIAANAIQMQFRTLRGLDSGCCAPLSCTFIVSRLGSLFIF